MSLYLIAKLKVKYGHVAEAGEILAKFVPIFEPLGWKLLGSFHPLIGDFSEITDIWEVADANVVPNALAAVAENPEFHKVFAEFREVVESEVLSVCAKFPFSP
jgi:hypothetical protein